MTSPIDPEMCLRTGRLLTEWFEKPEYTLEDIREMAAKEFDLPQDQWPKGPVHTLHKTDPEAAALQNKITRFIHAKRTAKWPGGMTKQEVQWRLNEATKMVDPTNYKFLPDDVRERTGLEINPLWMIECLVRSGTLGPKEQVAALKELAQYTHSKAPSINHTTTTQLKPEDWLLELAKEEYQVLGVDIPIPQPMMPRERGAGADYEKVKRKKIAEQTALLGFGGQEFAQMEAELEDIDLSEFGIEDRGDDG